jgi:hypothetical protein
MTRSKRDANETQILATLRDLGVFYREMAREAGFDLLLCWRGQVWIMEIKNGALPPSACKLTPNEQRTAAELQAVGIEYHVCNSLDEVLALLLGG